MTSLVRDLIGQKQRSLYTFCAYCGAPCIGYTCRAHTDLPGLDPELAVVLRVGTTGGGGV